MVSKAKAEMILKWHKDGYEVGEISRLLKIGEEECRSIILHPELAEKAPKTKFVPEFIEPMFE